MKERMRKQLPYVFLVLCFALIGSMSVSAAEPVWQQTFTGNIEWQKLTATGDLLVCTGDALCAVNPDDGSIRWSIEELKGTDEENCDLLDYTPYALITKGKGIFKGGGNKLTLIDVTTGQEKWNTQEIGITSSSGNFLLPQSNALIIVGALGKNPNERTLICVDLETGKQLWQQKDFFKDYKPELIPAGKTKVSLEGNQFPVYDSDESIIVYWSKKGLRKINVKTGETVWTCEFKSGEAPGLAYGYAPMFLSDDRSVLYTPSQKSLVAVKTSDGTLAWTKPPQFKGLPWQLEMTSQGILVKGGPNNEGKDGDPFITLVDPASGALKWAKPFDKLKDATDCTVDHDHVIVAADKKMYTIMLADGSFKELAKDLKMDGGETTGNMEVRENGYLLKSSQNLLMIDKSGNEVFHAFYKAPGTSMFAKIASTAAIAAVNTMAAADAHSRAMNQAMQTGHGSASYSLITSNPTLSKRYKATKSSDNFVIMLTDIKDQPENGVGLVKVGKADGKIAKSVVLGTKKPEYQFDEVESKLFFKADDKKIACYAF